MALGFSNRRAAPRTWADYDNQTLKRRWRAAGGLIAGTALVAAFIAPVLAQGTSRVLVTNVDGPIKPVIADHLAAAVEQAVGGSPTTRPGSSQLPFSSPLSWGLVLGPSGCAAPGGGRMIRMQAYTVLPSLAANLGADRFRWPQPIPQGQGPAPGGVTPGDH
jgi:hypothetical protein